MNLRRGQKILQAKEYIQRRTQIVNLLGDLSPEMLQDSVATYTRKWLDEHGEWEDSWQICRKNIVVFFAFMVACSTSYGEGGFRRIINSQKISHHFGWITEMDIQLLFPKTAKRVRHKKGAKKKK